MTNLASLYGYTGSTVTEFTTLLQKNYTVIFSANDAKTAVTEPGILLSLH